MLSAAVTPNDGFHRTGDAGDLLGWARTRLAGFKCPASVTLTAELPRNATGKVLRSVLREPHWAGQKRRVS